MLLNCQKGLTEEKIQNAEILGPEACYFYGKKQNNMKLLNSSIRAGFENQLVMFLLGTIVLPMTPLDMALAKYDISAVHLLQQHGAKRAEEMPREEIIKQFNIYNAQYDGQLKLATAQTRF